MKMLRLALVLLIGLLASGVLAQDGAATLPPPADGSTPVATEEAAAEPDSALGLEQSAALPILLAARSDLEILATQAIGTSQRPLGWNGSIDTEDPDLPLKIRLDLELLASTIMADVRPEGWFGVVATVPIGIARDIRHDLELLADGVMSVATIRPAGWQGDNPIYRCGRATQSILIMLEKDGLAVPVDPTQPDYCQKAEIQRASAAARRDAPGRYRGDLSVHYGHGFHGGLPGPRRPPEDRRAAGEHGLHGAGPQHGRLLQHDADRGRRLPRLRRLDDHAAHAGSVRGSAGFHHPPRRRLL
ncbi:MAG: hypothetical protein IPK19_26725 [Chloroflexi bacterium]|nr:hypothetical protein [Chloroflexota bacterium]